MRERRDHRSRTASARELGVASAAHLSLACGVALAGLVALGQLGGALGASIGGVVEAHRFGPGPVAVSGEAGLFRATARAAERAADLAPLPGGQPLVIPWHELHAGSLDAFVDGALARANARLNAAMHEGGPRTYASTITPIEDAAEEVNHALSVIDHLASVLDDAPLGEAHARAAPRLRAFLSGLYRDARVGRALHAYDPGSERLTASQRRLVASMREWAGPPEHVSSRIRRERAAVEAEIDSLIETFNTNLAASQRGFEVLIDDAASLDGLSAGALARARSSAEAAGRPGYRFTLFDGTVTDALREVHDPAVRERLWRAQRTVGISAPHDNRPVVNRIVALRSRLAALHGEPNYAAYANESAMFGSLDEVESFLADLMRRAQPAAQREHEDLVRFRIATDGQHVIQPWDYAYWVKRYGDATFGELDARPYLPLERTLAGLYDVIERLHGVRFEEVELPRWHPDVRAVRATDADGRFLGYLQLDLFARPGKRPGAWMRTVSLGRGKGPSAGIVVGNFAAPPPGAPALLTLDETSTLFHEFGHALHVLLSESNELGRGGTRVAAELVELPSMLMENWVSEPEVLRRLARHHETGEPMPEALLERIVARRTFRRGSDLAGHLSMALRDFAIHRHFDPAQHGSALHFANRYLEQYYPYNLAEEAAEFATFQHPFTFGQAGTYYRYRWAEVLQASVFEKFLEAGLFSEEMAARFRKKILRVGATRDPRKAVTQFLRGEPRVEALLRQLGLLDA